MLRSNCESGEGDQPVAPTSLVYFAFLRFHSGRISAANDLIFNRARCQPEADPPLAEIARVPTFYPLRSINCPEAVSNSKLPLAAFPRRGESARA
jgi:hypothetical protein